MEVECYQLFEGGASKTQPPEQVLFRRIGTRATAPTCGDVLRPHHGLLNENGKGRINCKVAEKDQITRPSSANGQIKDRMAPNSRLVHCANCFLGVAVRVMLFVVFVQFERTQPFKRKIHPEELWLYKNPPTKDYVPASVLLPAAFFVPFTVICLNFLVSHDRYDFSQGISAMTLSLGLNGFLTSLLKVTVGRPRPDFYYRCFPDGKFNEEFDCTGDPRVVNEGRRSFPSGHSSFAFAGFGFVFLYLAAKLHVFNERGRSQAWRLCLTISPLVIAAVVAISRTCDYHHHWEDVTIGSILGMLVTYVSYRQYFPSIFASNSHRPYSNRNLQTSNCCISSIEDDAEQKPLIDDEKETKWI